MKDLINWFKKKIAASEQSAADSAMPAILRPYFDMIEATRRPILAATVGENPPAHPAGSQLGGRPWWPARRAYPTGKDDVRLYLLAQINFSEVPHLVPFPDRGLLQFFVAGGDLYGANFDNPKSSDGFMCVYHEATDEAHVTDFDDITLGPDDHLPLETPLVGRALTFSTDNMPVDLADYRFDHLVPALASASYDDDALFDAYNEWSQSSAIRLGGYPSFTQDDPRSFRQTRSLGDFNLLTVESTTGIMWGDVGVAQFFISEDDLRARTFSNVAYNWDCH